MTDTKKLKGLILKKGLKLKFIAEELGLSTYGLQLKLNNSTEFKVSEISTLSDILNLNSEERDRIFFKS